MTRNKLFLFCALFLVLGLIGCGEDTVAPVDIDDNDDVGVNDIGVDADVSEAPSCDDGIRNGNETDIDCGGPDCEPCELDSVCSENGDCESASCVDEVCVPGGCEDVECEDDESCYRGICYDACEVEGECGEGFRCYQGHCAPLDCDGVHCEEDEGCHDGICYDACTEDEECAGSLYCVDNVCLDACDDVECGDEQSCSRGICYDECQGAGDCDDESRCSENLCVPLDCQDIQCRDDEVCYYGECLVECVDEDDCSGNEVCEENACIVPSCSDEIQNGEETDIDCGGPDCEPCGTDQICAVDGDCVSGHCDNGSCVESCDLPWGGSIEHGEEVTAYENESVACDTECISETRVCDNGILSGDFEAQSCEAPCDDCEAGEVFWDQCRGDVLSRDHDEAQSVDNEEMGYTGSAEFECVDGDWSFAFGSCELSMFALTIENTGDGDGMVTADIGSIDCGSACSADYQYGEDVVLTATAESGSLFAGWSGACSGANAECTVVITEITNVTATFDESQDPCGLPWGGSIEHGEEVTAYENDLVACDTECISETRVCDNGILSGDFEEQSCEAPCADCEADEVFWDECRGNIFSRDHEGTAGVGNVETGYTGSAQFQCFDGDWSFSTGTCEVETVELSIFKSGDADGTVTSEDGDIDCGSDCSVEYEYGDEVVLTATAESGALFASWSDACSGDLAECTLVITEDLEVTASFGMAGTTWVSADLGGSHTCAIRDDGTLWCWGADNRSQLNNGTRYENENTPLQIGLHNDWESVSAGRDHTCAIRDEDTLWCWGAQRNGRIGNGATNTGVVNTPYNVSSTIGWSSVSAGNLHTCGIKTDGTLWCWGYGSSGRLGTDGWTTGTPEQVGTENDWAQVSASFGAYTCGVKTDGSMWCWGNNGWGQLGDPNLSFSNVPIAVGDDTDWSTVSSGLLHVCGLREDNTIWCWGGNDDGQVGVDVDEDDSHIPAQVGSHSDWESVSAGSNHTCGNRADGKNWCWGTNSHGMLGDGTEEQRDEPTQVGTASDWHDVYPGNHHTCGLRSANDALWCWGGNGGGQVGDGTEDSRTSPVPVVDPVE